MSASAVAESATECGKRCSDDHGGGKRGGGECSSGNSPDVPSAQQDQANDDDKSGMLRDSTSSASQFETSPKDALDDENATPTNLVTENMQY